MIKDKFLSIFLSWNVHVIKPFYTYIYIEHFS